MERGGFVCGRAGVVLIGIQHRSDREAVRLERLHGGGERIRRAAPGKVARGVLDDDGNAVDRALRLQRLHLPQVGLVAQAAYGDFQQLGRGGYGQRRGRGAVVGRGILPLAAALDVEGHVHVSIVLRVRLAPREVKVHAVRGIHHTILEKKKENGARHDEQCEQDQNAVADAAVPLGTLAAVRSVHRLSTPFCFFFAGIRKGRGNAPPPLHILCRNGSFYFSSALAAAAFSAAAALAFSACAFCIALNFSFSSAVGIGSMVPRGQAFAHILQFLHLS